MVSPSLTAPPSDATWQSVVGAETTSVYNSGPRGSFTPDLTTAYLNSTPNASADWGEWTFIAYVYADSTTTVGTGKQT
jgi:hypothetical protein